jgi:hypothetical protein
MVVEAGKPKVKQGTVRIDVWQGLLFSSKMAPFAVPLEVRNAGCSHGKRVEEKDSTPSNPLIRVLIPSRTLLP